MNLSAFEDVGEFQRKFELPRYGDGRPPTFLTEDLLTFRIGFILEELAEFCAAHSRKDMVGCADALADLTYVVLGLAHFMAVPFNEVWSEIQRANMTKERAAGADDPRSKRNHAFDIVKPPGWTPPSHDEALIKAALTAWNVDPDRGCLHFKGMTFKEFMEAPAARTLLEAA